ncbi:MAG: DUF294 nucleotidyltransferase-like domain-containing protein [Desulfobacterales bacterium]|nr:DUF294 nucleotidyltransferase-like domain-containing protein [Desulfobacterales bacterium]
MSLTLTLRPISDFRLDPAPCCPPETPVREAARLMETHHCRALLIADNSEPPLGLVSHRDFARHMPVAQSPFSISQLLDPSRPLPLIQENQPLGLALARMEQLDRHHLAVEDQEGEIKGILSRSKILDSALPPGGRLVLPLEADRDLSSLTSIHSRLPDLLRTAIYQGSPVDELTQFIEHFSQSVLERVISHILNQRGPAPCPFVFLIMGSEGRGEQTLISDQDNAILFQDLPTDRENREAKAWFDQLAREICTTLDRAGFALCQGNNMAMNSKWCQPMSVWKQYFFQWIRSASPKDLLHAGIFFDFKGGYGHLELAEELRQYLFDSLGAWSGFLRNMTENALEFRPPLGLFGKFQVASKGSKKNTIDLKYAQLPIIDVTRVYALKYKINTVHTPTRLFRLYTRHALTAREYQDILQSYQFLMKLRFRRQITAVTDEGRSPDNDINPDNLSHLDRHRLREVFKLIEKFQQKLGIEFTGIT